MPDLQIDIHGVLTVKFKSDPPVSRNGNRKLSLPITYKRVELAARQVHVPCLFRCIQPDQHPFDGRSMLSGHVLVTTPRKPRGNLRLPFQKWLLSNTPPSEQQPVNCIDTILANDLDDRRRQGG